MLERCDANPELKRARAQPKVAPDLATFHDLATSGGGINAGAFSSESATESVLSRPRSFAFLHFPRTRLFTISGG